MAALALNRPEVLLTGPAAAVSVPTWVRRFSPTIATASQVRSLYHLAPLTVVRAKALGEMVGQKDFLSLLAARQMSTARPSKILFVFDRSTAPTSAQELLSVLKFFRRADDIGFARGAEQGAFALEVAFAKILAERQQTKASVDSGDPLGQIKSVVGATADLRAESGRLSAQRVAEAFGLSVAELAGLAGRSRQSVSKADDAPSLQPALLPYERIARLRAVLPTSDFRRWLHLPSEPLDGRSPLDLIRASEVESIADLAEGMLTGSPN
jgi:hypothetical protein